MINTKWMYEVKRVKELLSDVIDNLQDAGEDE